MATIAAAVKLESSGEAPTKICFDYINVLRRAACWARESRFRSL